MATLGELADELRGQIVMDGSTDYHPDSQLLDMVTAASRELAAEFQFPRVELENTLSSGANRILTFGQPVEVLDVSVDGVSIRRAPLAAVRFQQARPAQRWPQVYFYDHAFRANEIPFGPALKQSSDALVRMIGDPYPSATPTTDTDVWEGLYPGWHHLVLYRAAISAMQTEWGFEQAQYYTQQYAIRLQAFARFLGVPMQAQEATG